MAKRFPRQNDRSYRSSSWGADGKLRNYIKRDEVLRHVSRTWRCDADPIFNELAHQAALNGLQHHYVGDQGVSFTQPTTKPNGYFSILKWIIAHPQCTKREIDTNFGAKIITTIDRLCAGGLIHSERLHSKATNRVIAHFSATDFGKAYAVAAARYVVKRS